MITKHKLFKVIKKSFIVVLVFAMTFGLMQVNNASTSKVNAEETPSAKSGGLTLGSITDINHPSSMTTYQYGNATISTNPGAMEISVDNGSFQLSNIPNNLMLVKATTTGGTVASSLNTSTKYTKIQVFSTSTISNAQTVLRSITFYKNVGTVQNVSVKIDTKTLGNYGVSYNSSNGHLYKYYNSKVSWETAYGKAKETLVWGNKGYLATISNESENTFLRSVTTQGFYIGGTRRLSTFDADSYRIYSTLTNDWRWACGPEAGNMIYSGSPAAGQIWNSSQGTGYGYRYRNWFPNGYGQKDANYADSMRYGGKVEADRYASGYRNWDDVYNTFGITDDLGYRCNGYMVEWSDYNGHNFSLSQATGSDTGSASNTIDDRSSISASDGFITQTQAKALSSMNAMAPYNNASGKDSNGNIVTPTASTSNWSSIANGAVGSYNVKYTAGTQSKTVKLIVIPDGSIISPNKDFAIYAKDATIKQTAAMALTNATQLINIHSATVYKLDGTTATPNVTTSQWSDITAGDVTKSPYSVRFSYGTGTDYTYKDVSLTLDPDLKHTINADNGFIYQSQAKALSSTTQLNAYNNASAITNAGLNVTPIASTTSWASIQAGTIGSYDVTYTYGSGATQGTKTVKLTVIPDGSVISSDKKFAVYAKDTILKSSEARAIANQNQLVNTHSALVYIADGTTATPTVNVGTNWSYITSGTIGSYGIEFSYTLNTITATKTAKLTVVSDKDIINPDRTAAIHAEDASVTQSQAAALNVYTDVNTYTNAYVTLADGTRTIPVTTVVDFTTIKSGTVGTYPVQYAYGTGSNAINSSVNLTVTTEPKHIINATSGWITVSQAKALSSVNQLISYNSASVTTLGGVTTTPNVNTTSWSSIKAGVEGVYDVTYSYGTGFQEGIKTVQLHVVPDSIIISPDGDFALYADGGYIYASDAKNLTGVTDLIPYNNAFVELLDSSTRINPNVTCSSYSSIKAGIEGDYQVTYSYGTGSNAITKTVNLSVIPDGTPIDGDFIISADSSFLKQSEAKALTDPADLIPINNATVLFYKTGVRVNPSIAVPDYSSIKAGTIGSYPATYSYSNPTGSRSIVVQEVVVPDDSEISDTFALYAQNGVMTPDEAKNLTSLTGLIPYNKAVVYLLDGTTTNPTSIIASGWSSITTGVEGSYNVTYGYGSGASAKNKTVKLMITKGVIPPDRSFALYAEDAIISPDEAKALTSINDLIPLNNAKVTFPDGTTANPYVSSMDWSAIKTGRTGIYNVTYTYGTGSNRVSTTVKLTIADGIGTNFKLNAKNAMITIDEAKALTSRNDLVPINSAVVTLKDGSTVTPSIAVTNADWLLISNGYTGTYNVMYSYTLGTETRDKTVVVTVYDPDDGTISPNKDFVIYADNTIITQTEAMALTGMSDINTYTHAYVGKDDGTTDTPAISVPSYASIKAGTVGIYNVTYNYGTGSDYTYRTVKLRVVDDDAIISLDRTYALYALDKTIDKEAAKLLTNKEELIPLNSATVYLSDGTTAVPTVTSLDFADIQAGKVGNHAVTYTYKDVSKSVSLAISTDYTEAYLFDYNGNGIIDVTDKSVFNYYLANPSAQNATIILMGDANGNGTLDIADKALLNYYLANSSVTPPIVQIPN
ncbi:MAG: hypothetical protein PHH04_06160 [Thomasclavelia sp.]|jgi:hypothetical protein|nr:hypothetical protein [Thomasclavelia sp.]